MTIAKWSAISFFGLGALTVAGMAACSVSSTDPTPGSSSGTTPITGDQDSSTPDTTTCTANTRETIGPLVSQACQDRLDVACCNELANCFNVVPTDTTKTQDCNQYITCLDRCNFKSDGTTACTTDADCTAEGTDASCEPEADGTKKCEAPETDDTLFAGCKMDCQALTQDDVIMNEESLEVCIKGDTAADSACNGNP